MQSHSTEGGWREDWPGLASRFSDRPSGLSSLEPETATICVPGWGCWLWVKSRGQRPGPGLPDQSLKCQTYLALAEFSHVSRGILPRTVDESTVFLQVFLGAED